MVSECLERTSTRLTAHIAQTLSEALDILGRQTSIRAVPADSRSIDPKSLLMKASLATSAFAKIFKAHPTKERGERSR